METICVVCGRNCSAMCSLVTHLEDERVLRAKDDSGQPFIARFVCAYVCRGVKQAN